MKAFALFVVAATPLSAAVTDSRDNAVRKRHSMRKITVVGPHTG